MRLAAVVSDLMLYSRIEAAASVAGAELLRVDSPGDVPDGPAPDLVLVDWSAREPDWGEAIAALKGRAPQAQVIAFGPHVDLDAHAAAREAGVGPMWARSRLLSELPSLLDGARTHVEGGGRTARG